MNNVHTLIIGILGDNLDQLFHYFLAQNNNEIPKVLYMNRDTNNFFASMGYEHRSLTVYVESELKTWTIPIEVKDELPFGIAEFGG